MRLGLLAIVLLGFTHVATAAHWTYAGDFTQIQVTGDAKCGEFFTPTHYQTKFFRLGPTGYKVLLQFLNVDRTATGGLHQVNLLGYLGGSGDIQVTNRLELGDSYAQVRAQGIVDPDVLYIEVKLDLYKESPASTELICSAKAEYLGD